MNRKRVTTLSDFCQHPLWLWLLFLFCILASNFLHAQNPTDSGVNIADSEKMRQAWVLDLKGVVGPATSDYVVRNLTAAADAGAILVILKIDTPGGLDKSMRSMIKAILAAKMPVVTYVSPQGARAASAGTYILYASHIAAMAPATNLGAATPIQIGAPSLPSPQTEKKKDTEQMSPMQKKIVNDAVAYIRGLAILRERNADWAEQAVREGKSLTADAALEEGVIDIVAVDITDLLKQLDGREVKLNHQTITISTEQLTLNTIETDWRTELLTIITDPNIAYILMMIGVYGLILEFYNPGTMVPGVVGAVSLLLALYAFQLLPVNYAGLGLIVLGAALMVAEAFAPSFGILGLGGLTAFVLGSIILLDTKLVDYQISLLLIGAFAIMSIIVLIVTLGMIIKSRAQSLVSGVQMLVGQTACVLEDFSHSGQVMVQGEIWQAETQKPLHKGDLCRVDKVQGLVLKLHNTEETKQ